MDDKDFPEDNVPKKQRAKALGNLKNSTLTSPRKKVLRKNFWKKNTKSRKGKESI